MRNRPGSVSNLIIKDAQGEIPVRVIYSRRKTLQCHISADRDVVVRAPYFITSSELDRLLSRRVPWMRKRLRQHEDLTFLNHGKTYEAGEIHYFRGEAYPLRIRRGALQSVHLDENGFVVTLNGDIDEEKVRKLMYAWYREQAERIIRPVFDRLAITHSSQISGYTGMVFRKMRRRWGSCSSKGLITLNTELMKLPDLCIEYVICHEMAHLRYMDHSKAFYAHFSALFPGAEKAKAQLDRYRI